MLTIWHDIESTGQDAFLEWHTLEHMIERASIPGFVRGRRGVAVDPEQSPKYVTLYEATEIDVFCSESYRELLNNPTPWTRRIQPMFQEFVRFANTVDRQRGIGDGVFVTTVRFETTAGTGAGYAENREEIADLAWEIESVPAVNAVTIAQSRDDITDYVTDEAKMRPPNPALDGVAHVAVFMVDTVTEEAAKKVRDLVWTAGANLGTLTVGHCSTFLVDCVVNADQVERAPLTESRRPKRS